MRASARRPRMDAGRSRRALLRAGGGALAALSGCLGVGGGGPGCADDVRVVLRSRLRGWYVSYPATTGLFDVDGEERGGPAARLVRRAEAAGYTAEYYYAEDYGRGNDDEWQVELYGELDRSTVERLVAEADMPDATEISERSGALSRGSELKWPWSPGLLEGRAAFLAENAPTVGVRVPAFGPTGDRAVALRNVPDAETLAWLRSVLSGRGVLRVAIGNVPEDDDPLTESAMSNYHAPRGDDPYFSNDGATLHEDGTVDTGLYVEPLLKTVYRPGRAGDDLPYLERARLRVSLDGRIVSTRPLNDAERSYLRAYRDYIDAGDLDEEAPSPPDLRLTSVDGRTALRAATLLAYPEDARFGVEVEYCGDGTPPGAAG